MGEIGSHDCFLIASFLYEGFLGATDSHIRGEMDLLPVVTGEW